MQLNKIVQTVNSLLAGETLSYQEMLVHLDLTIDEINAKLSSKFPAFSDFNSTDYPDYPDYKFFPDSYVRSVVCVGAASKFFIVDEEGAISAPALDKKYEQNLFLMQRDYSCKVPEEFQDHDTGYLVDPEEDITNTPFKITFGGEW